MKRKTITFAAAAVFCLLGMLAACGGNEAAPSAAAPATPSPPASGGSKLVFHDVIDDPQVESLDSLGGGGSDASGTASLDLVLYKTGPDVFEGYGIMHRRIEITQDETEGSKQEYVYRTGLVRAETGKEGRITLTGWLTENRRIPSLAQNAPFDVEIHKDATLRQEGLPLMLTLNGNQAQLSIKLHDDAEFVFSGEQTEDPADSPVGRPSDPDSLVYINSMWSSSFSGENGGGDYTAVLLASPETGRDRYAGHLSVQGTESKLAGIEEAVAFSLEPFNAVSYRKAGGQREDLFSQMGVLHTQKGDYLLLLDGDQIFLEPAGKEPCFCGSLQAQSESAVLENEADKTRTMLRYLLREKSVTPGESTDYSELKALDPNNPEDMQKLMELSEELGAPEQHGSAPDWYPSDLIPMVHYSAYDGFLTLSSGHDARSLFRRYDTSYCEEADFEDLAEPYRAVLSEYDGYREYLDYDNAEGVFLFTMGKYTVQVFLQQSVIKLTDVKVLID